MRTMALGFSAIQAMWEAADDKREFPDVWRTLPTEEVKGVTDRMARGVYHLLVYLRREHDAQRPVLVAAPAPAGEVDTRCLAAGVVPLEQLPKLAGIAGYNLGEDTVLRLVALHDMLTAKRDGRLPINPQPASTGERHGHEGTLLKARERVVNSLYLHAPQQILADAFQSMGQPAPDPEFRQTPGPDIPTEWLRQHLHRDPVWGDLDRWWQEAEAWETAVRDLALHTQETIMRETGLTPEYERDPSKPHTPGEPPEVLRPFGEGILNYAFQVRSGEAPFPGEYMIGSIRANSDLRQLHASLGAGGFASVATGPRDVVFQAREAHQRILRSIVEGQQVLSLQETYVTLTARRQVLQQTLRNFTEQQIVRGSCSGCPRQPERR